MAAANRFRTVVADDAEDMRELIVAALDANGGFEVVAQATDAAGAVECVREQRPHLALVDLGMPMVSGLDVLPDLREASPETRVVIISGFPREDMADIAATRGAAGFVEKGLSIKRLVDDIVMAAGVLELVEAVLAESRTQLDQDTRSPSAARRFVTETLNRWDCATALDTVELLVSEVVTNAVLHAQSAPDVAVQLRADTIRVEVTDRDPIGLPKAKVVAEIPEEDTSGRGVGLVDLMASAWGVETIPGGKVVWFEVPRFDATDAAGSEPA